MTDAEDLRDQQLLDELRGMVARLDAPPPEVAEAARAAYSWRTVDAELAALTYDSLLDDRALAGVRGPGGPQMLSFESPEVTIDVEIAVEPGDRRRLLAQLAPPQAAQVEVRTPDTTTTTDADDLGRVALGGLPPGPLSLSWRLTSGAVIETEWTTV